jgi:hypothetical protein
MVSEEDAVGLLSLIAIASSLIVFPYCQTASAGPCEKSLSPDPIAEGDGYRERDGGTRCEGIYTSPVAGESVEIVSISQGRLSYDLGRSGPLFITLAIQPTNSAPVHVRAVGIPERLYYEMDADIPASATLVWPIKEVVAPERIAAADIGVYAFHAGVGSDPVLLPVSISGSAAPPASMQPLIVILRVGDVASLTWRFVPKAGAPGQFNPANIDDNRITLTLPATVHLPGLLELRWEEGYTGKSHIKVIALGD